ncbi:hypothetical protein J6590_091240 [Homalodisca vitripennis]|nr:hypothetical protein J6590_091240 [Homalodisca vitripennis]
MDFHEFVNRIVLIYTLAKTVSDKTKICAVLNLETLERQISLKLVNSSKDLTYELVTMVSLIIYLFHIWENVTSLMFLFSQPHKAKAIFIEVNDVYFNVVKCSQFFGYTLFVAKFSRIQNGIIQGLTNLANTSQESLVLNHFRYPNRRQAWVEDVRVCGETLNFIKRIRGNLFQAEREIGSYYKTYLTWLTIVSAVWSPIIVLKLVVSSLDGSWHIMFYTITLVIYPVMVMVVVLVHSELHYKKPVVLQQLATMVVNSFHDEPRRTIKHQLLAYQHRLSPHYTYLFDIEYPLLATILDSTLLIVCGVLSG